ncbi:unnamed protein product [Sphagnum jensenii]|uniref:4Fe-4S ferredoxin-type domain-containing protein n=1 Tax=Sphagnum jensenii TaxID=128206 RepID=A0ABP1A4E4_9BRYO
MKLETGCHARTCTLDCPKNCFLGSYVTPSENWVYRFDGIFYFGLKPRISSYRPKPKALCDKRKFEKVWS